MNGDSDGPDAERALLMATDLRVLMSRLRRRTREARPLGFSNSQLLALSRLEREGPATVTSLARSEGIRPQSMGASVAALEQAGLIKRSPDPSDGRQSILSLTPASRRLIKVYRAAREDWLFRSIRSRLTLSEQRQLAKTMDLIKRLLD
jgi:DNA-binding MarR family transcriptional regulator